MITTKSFIAFGVTLSIGLGVFGYQVQKAVVRGREFDRYFSVRGLSEKVVKSTSAIWPIKYVVAEENLPDLKKSIERVQSEVFKFLSENGFDESEYRVGPPRVEDMISLRRIEEREKLPRYSASATIVVRSSKVDSVKRAILKSTELLDKGIAIRSSEYGEQVEFLFEGVNELKPAMIEEATANARSAADKFAADSRAKVGAIRRASQGVVEINDRDQASPELKTVRVVTTIDFFIE